MSIITNNNGVPEEYVMLAEDDGYDNGGADFSITTLIDSPQVRWLRERNPWSHEVDVADRLAAMIGTGIHKVFEGAAAKRRNVKVEQRFTIEIAGKKISGGIDKMVFHDDGSVSLHDLKVVTVDSLSYGERIKSSWVDQLNSYAAMLRTLGFEIKDLWVDLILKDWRRSRMKYKPDYPSSPIEVVPVPMLSPEEALAYLEGRVALHTQDPPSECTQAEYWGQDPKYAVYEKFKNGTLKKRASRVLDSVIDAEAYVKQNGVPAQIVARPGRRVRCEDNWCGVASVCPQYKRALDELEAMSKEEDI